MSTQAETLAWYTSHYDASDPFGSYLNRDPNGPGHLGSDFNGLPEGSPVPSWCAGTVIVTEYNSWVGYSSVIQRAAGGYALLYHQVPGTQAPVGTVLAIGSTVGHLGNTGSTSGGAHAHWGFSPATPTVATANVIDPWPIILSDLNSASPGGSGMPTPFTIIRTDDIGPLPIVTQSQIDADFSSNPLLTLPFVNGSTTATNFAEATGAPAGTLFDIVISLDIANLPSDESVTVRTAYWSKTSPNPISTLLTSTIVGGPGGKVRGQHVARARLDGTAASNLRTMANTRLVVQAGSSVAGVTIERLRIDEFIW